MYPKSIPLYKTPFFGQDEELDRDGHELVKVSVHESCDVGMHSHDFLEINIVLRGKGCHYIGEMAVPLESGEFFVIPPNVLHGYYCEDRLDVCHIILHGDFLARYGEELSRMPGYQTLFEIEPYLRQVYDDSLFLRLDGEKLECVRSEIADIMSVVEEGFSVYRTVLVLEFLCGMCYYAKCRRVHSAETIPANTHIMRVLEHIRSHYSEQISIESLMQIANMSRPTLHRRFKEITRMTPLEYIIKCRVTAAKQLLSQGQLSRTEVAQRCGFFDTSHMNKYLRDQRI